MPERKFRVAEVFGPTIQGEGRNVGAPCYFIRFGGCDFRCTWCDSPHAVLPEEVNKLEQVTEWGILHKINNLHSDDSVVMSPTWVVLTGGNPGLLNLTELVRLLHVRKHKVMVETQGSTFRPWFGDVDDLCFSPKPPSSKMEWDFKLFDRVLEATLSAQLDHAAEQQRASFPLPYLKVPIFTEEDLEFAAQVIFCWGGTLEVFLSIGNDSPALPTVGNPNPPAEAEFHEPTLQVVLENQRKWTERILTDQRFDSVRIFSQQHVLLWGNQRGR